MSTAEEIWRAGDGLSKQKTVRIIWPELADALTGITVADAAGEPQQPCVKCGRNARGVCCGAALCGYCIAQRPHSGHAPRRVPEWRAG